MFHFHLSATSEFDPVQHLDLIAARIKTGLILLPAKESPHNGKWQLGLAKEVVSPRRL